MGKVTHGMRGSPEYIVWRGMRARCENPRATDFEHYGGRGIKVCERWQKFENFYADMGPRPPARTLDRINNDGNYEPGNCRWATLSEQRRGRRPLPRATHCKRGHPFAGDNLLVAKDGTRECRTCRRAQAREWYRKQATEQRPLGADAQIPFAAEVR